MSIRLYLSFAAAYLGFQLRRGMHFPQFSDDLFSGRSPAFFALKFISVVGPFLRVAPPLNPHTKPFTTIVLWDPFTSLWGSFTHRLCKVPCSNFIKRHFNQYFVFNPRDLYYRGYKK